MRKFTFILISFLISALYFSLNLLALESKDARIILDGRPYKTTNIYNFEGYQYFSVRDLASLYGITLQWYPVSGKITLIKNNNELEIYVKSTRLRINNKKKRLNVPVQMENDNAYIPAEMVSTDYFADFTDAKTSFSRNDNILYIKRNPDILLQKSYRKGNATHLVFKIPERTNFEWEISPKIFEITFSRGITEEEITPVSDGIVDNICLSNSEGQPTAVISVLSDTSNMQFKPLKKRGTLEIVITSEVIVPVADNNEAETEALIQFEDGEESDIFPILPATAKGLSGRKRTIIIDPGHGGEDPGAIGPDGTLEKDITLAISKKLQNLLDRDGNYNTHLTRNDDTFIPLVERTNYANEKRADLFVSIHCNASLNKDSSGFEIYFLSESASDSDAQATAILENSAIQFEKKPTKNQKQLQELLWSMAVNEFINDSSELSGLIAEEVSDSNKIENRGVKQAGFFVLKGAGMPAVLVEVAFISNKREESKLNKNKFQNEAARLIYMGIKRYEERKNTASQKG